MSSSKPVFTDLSGLETRQLPSGDTIFKLNYVIAASEKIHAISRTTDLTNNLNQIAKIKDFFTYLRLASPELIALSKADANFTSFWDIIEKTYNFKKPGKNISDKYLHYFINFRQFCFEQAPNSKDQFIKDCSTYLTELTNDLDNVFATYDGAADMFSKIDIPAHEAISLLATYEKIMPLDHILAYLPLGGIKSFLQRVFTNRFIEKEFTKEPFSHAHELFKEFCKDVEDRKLKRTPKTSTRVLNLSGKNEKDKGKKHTSFKYTGAKDDEEKEREEKDESSAFPPGPPSDDEGDDEDKSGKKAKKEEREERKIKRQTEQQHLETEDIKKKMVQFEYDQMIYKNFSVTSKTIKKTRNKEVEYFKDKQASEQVDLINYVNEKYKGIKLDITTGETPVIIDYKYVAVALQRFIEVGSNDGIIYTNELRFEVNPGEKTDFNNLEAALAAGMKPLDAVLYLSLRQTPNIKITHRQQNIARPDISAINKACFVAYFYLITRAYWPSTAGNISGHPVPNYLKTLQLVTNFTDVMTKINMLTDNSSKVWQSTWIRYIKLDKFGQKSISRILLGVAGYRWIAVIALVEPDFTDDPVALRARAAVKVLYKKGYDWGVHPLTRTEAMMAKTGSLNKNLNNLALRLYSSDTLERLKAQKVIYDYTPEIPGNTAWTTWSVITFDNLQDPMFPDAREFVLDEAFLHLKDATAVKEL